MKKIFLLILIVSGLYSSAQVQYGGQIRGQNNSGTIDVIKRTGDALKVNDSINKVTLDAINTKIPSSLTVTSTRLLVDGSGVTQPVSGTVTINAIPAGTNNIGDVDVLTVPADPFGVNADAASATGSISAKLRFIAATGIPVTSLPSVTIGTFPDNEPFNVAQINGVTPLMGAGNGGTGSLRVNIASDQVAIPVSGTVSITANSAVNVAQINGVTPLMGNGITGTGSQRVTLASDMTAISTTGYMSVKLDQTTLGTTNGVTVVPSASGGLSTYHLVSAGSTNATNVKASAGQLYGYYIFNANASARKVAFHNTAGTPTAGASVAWSIVIPAGSAANVEWTNGVAFSTGIGITTVTGTADADATAVAAGDFVINLFYK